MVHGKIAEADAATFRMDATPFGLSVAFGAPTSIIPVIFMLDVLPVATLPIYPGLGQALCMLGCISSGLISV